MIIAEIASLGGQDGENLQSPVILELHTPEPYVFLNEETGRSERFGTSVYVSNFMPRDSLSPQGDRTGTIYKAGFTPWLCGWFGTDFYGFNLRRMNDTEFEFESQ